MGTILTVHFVRGLLFVGASLPVIVLWSASRNQLVMRLGLALFITGATFEIVLAMNSASKVAN